MTVECFKGTTVFSYLRIHLDRDKTTGEGAE